MEKIQPDKEIREYLCMFLASTLKGYNTDELFHIFTGTGSNGKSILTQLHKECLGDYCTTISVAFLTTKRGSSSVANPEIARTAGVRSVIFQEPEQNSTLNSSKIKEIAGNDTLLCRGLYKEFEEMNPMWSCIMCCNDLPDISQADAATFRRITVIPFESKFVHKPKEPNEFKRDDDILEKLLTVECKEMYISYLIKIFNEKYKKHRLQNRPAKITEQTDSYKGDCDIYYDFIVLQLDEDHENKMEVSEIFQYFKYWYKDICPDTKCPTKKSFKQYLVSNYGKLMIKNKHRYYWKFKIKDQTSIKMDKEDFSDYTETEESTINLTEDYKKNNSDKSIFNLSK